LAREYHRRTEEYDWLVCTGPIGRDGILPGNGRELGLINRNARELLKELEIRAERQMGIAKNKVATAIQQYRPNREGGEDE
jgi:hypothetical protein